MQVSYKMIQNLVKLLIIVAAIVLVTLILIDKNHADDKISRNSTNTSTSKTTTGTNTNSSSNPYAVLPPATVAPKVPECNQTISYNSAGVPSPIQCSNGYLNTPSWSALSAQEPSVMSLGYEPSQNSVQSAICNDVSASASDSAPGADDAIETSAFQISALYYGWNFASSASNYVSKC